MARIIKGSEGTKRWLCIACICTIGFGTSACEPEEQSRATPALARQVLNPETRPVAIVNGDPVSLDEFNTRFERTFKAGRRARRQEQQRALQIKQQLARELIDAELLNQAAKAQQLKPARAEIDHALQARLIDSFPGTESYRRHIAQIGGEAVLREAMRLRLIKERLTGVVPASEISDEQARAFYKEHIDRFRRPATVDIQQIVLRVPADAGGEGRERVRNEAESLRARLAEEKIPFTVAARRYSDAPEGPHGGYRGRLHAANTDKALWKGVSRLQPGGISPVIESNTGFHIVKLLRRNPPLDRAYAEAASEIKINLAARLRQQKVGALMNRLRAEATIDNRLAARYRPLAAALDVDQASPRPGRLDFEPAMTDSPLTTLGETASRLERTGEQGRIIRADKTGEVE